ncbi:thiopeptide maturation pyridine synthase [Streptomyces sp. ODS05-4]|uniref:thiopeptide maturation pyridine synthase n=1 Tax=Streptomyces sp. ODS05-4 TaxID=2944939 RepID=UPI00210AE625|nr:thiopeptide maturation pyridine synthase [Streptomyces sp. ODS05-4]
MSETPTTWATARVYYHDRDYTPLLLEAVQPLFAALERVAPHAYFVRHWKYGPHLRLRWRTDPRTLRDTIRPAVEEIVGGFLARRPSTAPVDPGELLRQHRRLAKLENEPGPLTPLAPDNSIAWSTGPLGRDAEDEVVQEFLAGFYADTTPLAFETVAATRRGPTDRYAYAIDLMVAVAHRLYPGPDNPTVLEGFVSYRSHAEAYIAMTPDRQAVRAHFEREYRRLAPALVHRVRACAAALDADVPLPMIQPWLAVAGGHIERGERLVTTGDLVMPFPRLKATGELGWDQDWVAHSRFHTMINDSGTYLGLLSRTPWFQRYRLALSLMYLHLNRIGLVPVERYLLSHLVANAVEEAYGVSAEDHVRAVIANADRQAS